MVLPMQKLLSSLVRITLVLLERLPTFAIFCLRLAAARIRVVLARGIEAGDEHDFDVRLLLVTNATLQE